MKNTRLPALVLTGAMLLSLAACGGKSAGTPAPSVPAAEDTATPVPAVEDTTTPAPAPEDTTKPVEAEPVESGAPSTAPTPKPDHKPVQSHPVETAPAPTPAPSAEPETALTAADVYAAVSAKAGGSAMIDASFLLTEYYNVSEDDLEDYAFYMPDMSANIEEIFIAKVKSGRMDAVKAACEGRQKGMAEDAETYPATGTYVSGYQLVTSGDWILFCVCENASAAADTFRNTVK